MGNNDHSGRNENSKRDHKESKVRRFSQGQELYTPKKRERKKEPSLSVDQYLRKATHDEAISGLVRSLFKTKIQNFSEWELDVATLLKKQTR